MDPHTFDELTKALATTTSRRTAMKTILASVVGGALGLRGIDAALAKPDCYGNRHKCNRQSDCCSKYYCNHGYCIDHSCYHNGHSCDYYYDCCYGYCNHGYCSDHSCYSNGHSCKYNYDCCSDYCYKGYCRSR
jgi:hypothetical protein